MPYVRCRGCGLLSYAPRSVHDVPSCPECALPLVELAGEFVERGDPGRRVDAVVRLTRVLLDADVAILSEIRDGREIAHRVSGEWPPLSSLEGVSLPLEDTFCRLLLEGRIGNYVADVESDERVRDLALARQLGVGAWMGVTLELSDARLYALCCLAREARPSLGAAEVRLLRGLAESVLADLETEHAN